MCVADDQCTGSCDDHIQMSHGLPAEMVFISDANHPAAVRFFFNSPLIHVCSPLFVCYKLVIYL
jgi:hypothetical protein